MGCGPFPAAGAEIFLELLVGDEIKVEAGHGFPPLESEMTKVLADVNGFSALTTDGVRLACQDAPGITKTGQHFDQIEISPAAQKILNEIKQAQEEEMLDED